MTYNENYEITILKNHLKFIGLGSCSILKQEPPCPDFIVNNAMYYEVTFCSYDQQTAEIYHKLGQRIPLSREEMDFIRNYVANVNDLIESTLNRIEIKRKKAINYVCRNNMPLNLLVHVYHGTDLDVDYYFNKLKSVLNDIGRFNAIHVQTGFKVLEVGSGLTK